MAIFGSDTDSHRKKLDEEYLYGVVANELANGIVSPGLSTKAIAEAGGDTKKADAFYIKLRVDMLRSERAAIDEQTRQLERSQRELKRYQKVAVEEEPPQTKPTEKEPWYSRSIPVPVWLKWIGVAWVVLIILGALKRCS